MQAAHLCKQIEEHTSFDGQIDQTHDDLTAGNVGKAHHKAGDPYQRAAVFQRSKQGGILDPLPLSCLG